MVIDRYARASLRHRPVVGGPGPTNLNNHHNLDCSREEVHHLELLPPDIRERMPELYANEEIGLAAQALVKFFTPDSNWTWYASEFDREDICFGLVIGWEAEFGYFSISELEAARGPLGMPIERDLHFEPAPLRELRDHYRQHGWAR